MGVIKYAGFEIVFTPPAPPIPEPDLSGIYPVTQAPSILDESPRIGGGGDPLDAAPFDKIQTGVSPLSGWIIVTGEFDRLDQAIDYTKRFRESGFHTAVFRRKGTYRTVLYGYETQFSVESELPGAKSINKNAYIREIETWCLNPPEEGGIYFCQ